MCVRAAFVYEALGEDFVNIFAADGFLRMWAEPNEYKEYLTSFVDKVDARTKLTRTAIATAQEGDWEGAVEAWPCLTAFLDRVSGVVRFVRHVLGGGGADMKTEDVVYLLKYEGRSTDMEVLLRDAANNNRVWRSLCDECIRTAGSSVRLRPVLERLVDQLKNSSLTASRLQNVVKEMKELQDGMRSQDRRESRVWMPGSSCRIKFAGEGC